MDCCVSLRTKGGSNAIQQCPFKQILGQKWCDRVVRLRLTIQSINSCQSPQVYQTSEYEWVQTFMMYDHGTTRFFVTAPAPIVGLRIG